MKDVIAHYMALPQHEQILWSVAVGVVVVVVAVVFILTYDALKGPSLHGDARWATDREMRKAGLMEDDGIIIGKHRGKFMMFGGQEFVSMIAPNRTGKGVGFVVPNLLNYDKTVICLDPKDMENFKLTSLYRQKILGQKVYVFNPYSLQSDQYNPMFYVSDDPHERPGDVLELGNVLFPYESGSNGIWSDGARNLFYGIALYLYETPDQTRSLGEVLRIGSLAKNELKALIRPGLSKYCVEALNRYIKTPEKQAGGYQGNFYAALSPYADPITDAVMSGNSFDLRKIKEENMSIYVCIPANKMARATPILNLFFTQLVNLNTDDFTHRYSPLVLMDEFPTIGYMPILDKTIGLIAGAGLRLAIVAQSVAQLSKPVTQGGYGQGAKVMLDQMGINIVYTPRDIRDAKELSETLGNRTVDAVSRQIGTFNKGSVTKVRKALELPQDLLQLPMDHQVILRHSMRPANVRKIAFYKEKVFIDRLKSVCPELKKIRGFPTQDQLDDIAERGLLSVPLPRIDIEEEHYVMQEPEHDFSSLPDTSDEPMSERDAEQWAEQFVAIVTS